MGEVLPLRWLGRTRRERVRIALQARVDEWARGWCPEAGSRVDLTACPSPRADLSWSSAALGRGVVAVGVAARAHAMIGAGLLGCSPDGADRLAASVGHRALKELADALSGGAGSVDECSRSSHVLSDRSGGALFTIVLGRTDVVVHLDALACTALVPASQPTQRALLSRREAVAAVTAEMQVTLPLGHVSLAQLANLKPGDVLTTAVRVGGLVQLAGGDGTIARTGHLVAAGDCRGIRIQ